jgi:hypothetical protein
MSKIVIGVLGFIAGAATGAGVYHLVFKKKLENQYGELNRSLQTLYAKKLRELDEADVTDVEPEEVENPIEEMDAEQKKEFYVNKLRELGYGTYEVEDEEDYEEVNPEEGPSDDLVGIELLSYNEYIRTDDSDLSVMSLTYYAGDNTIADEKGIVTDWRDLMGDDWLDVISKDNPTAYILNHDHGLLIDIEYAEGSFKELVEGVASDE